MVPVKRCWFWSSQSAGLRESAGEPPSRRFRQAHRLSRNHAVRSFADSNCMVPVQCSGRGAWPDRGGSPQASGAETRRRGARRHGDAETRRRGDAETRRRGGRDPCGFARGSGVFGFGFSSVRSQPPKTAGNPFFSVSSRIPWFQLRSLAQSRIPAMAALRSVAMKPTKSARSPILARSGRRSGAMAPMPPSWMPTEAKLAKPVSAKAVSR